MINSDTKATIDTLIDYAYDHTIERLNIIANSPSNTVYITLITAIDYKSFLATYLNYYSGCFEGILFTKFLEEFNRMPTPSENAFIKERMTLRNKTFSTAVLGAAKKKFNEFENNGWPSK